MNKERKEKIKSSAISWIVAIVCAIGIAVVMLCAAHSKGMLQKAHAAPIDDVKIGNIVVGQHYATEQYITPTGDCDNTLAAYNAGDRIRVDYPVSGSTTNTNFETMDIEVNSQQGICLLEFTSNSASGWILYSKTGNYWHFDSWYIYIDNNEAEYSGSTNEDISMAFFTQYQWSTTGTNATNAQGTLESILGFDGNDAPSGGDDSGGGGTVNETPTPANINDDDSLLAIQITQTVPHISGTTDDQSAMTLYGFELSNAAQFTNANSRGCPVIVQVLDRNGNILTTGEVSLSQQRNGQGATVYYFIPLCPMMYEYRYTNVVENAYQTRIRYKNAVATDAWYTFDAQYRTSNYTSIPNELWILNNSHFYFYNQYVQSEGYDIGYQAGYQTANNEATVAMGVYKGVDIVSGVFMKIGELLDVRLFGTIPLYVFILIPLIMGVVYVILKFVR